VVFLKTCFMNMRGVYFIPIYVCQVFFIEPTIWITPSVLKRVSFGQKQL
jgi:hypothetical protein